MGFDINETRTMLAAMEQGYKPTTTLVDVFFPHAQTFVTNTVSMEFRKGGRAMAPFVVQGGKGVNLARAGSQVRTYKPPMMRPKRNIEVADIAGRGFGETVYSTRTAAERAAEMRAKDLQELQEACARREEWMAAQCLLNGEYDIKGFADDGVAAVVDTMSFGFDGKTTLSGGDTWDNASAKIYDNIGDASQKIRRAAGDIPTVAICSGNVVKYLLANEQLYKFMMVPSRENMALLSLQPKLQRPDLMRVGYIQALNMKVLVKKFTLVRDGVTYNAGEIVDLPVEEATRLVNESGKEFALLAEVKPEAKNVSAPQQETAGATLESMTVEQLKSLASEHGIELGKATKKADIIGLILAAETDAGDENALPAIDAAALVK